MINAKEARNISQGNTKEFELALGKVENLINEEAAKGGTLAEIHFTSVIAEKVKDALILNDYEAYVSNHPSKGNIKVLKIKW